MRTAHVLVKGSVMQLFTLLSRPETSRSWRAVRMKIRTIHEVPDSID
jgi:hypothetical protein